MVSLWFLQGENTYLLQQEVSRHEKSADAHTLSVEILLNWGNFLILEEQLLFMLKKTL